MRNVFWNNGQRVIKQIFDWCQTAKNLTVSEFVTDFTDPGISKNSLNEFNIFAGSFNTPLTPKVTIDTGVAYDLNGNRIYIADILTAYDASAPSHTTNDGLGTLITTPRSTGNVNVPLTVNVNNYLWIDFLQATDDSVFTLHKITSAKQFYRQTDGYRITVTLVNTPPYSTSLKLGHVNLTSGGVVSPSTISKVDRLYFRSKEWRVKAKVPQASHADATTSYTFAEEIFVDDHVRAIGNGVVTAGNPHGMTAVDLGLSGVTIEDHQKFLHLSGIIGDVTSITSCLYPAVTVIEPGFDFITVSKLAGNELTVVDGLNKTPVEVPSDTVVSFTSFDATANYYVYLDKFSNLVQRTATDLVTTPDPTKFLICSLTWTYPGDLGPTDGDISNFVDRRHFGNLAGASSIILNDQTSSQLILEKSNITEGVVSGETGGKLRLSATDNLEVKTNGVTALAIDNVQKTTTQNSVNTAIGHMQEQGFDLIPAGTMLAYGGSAAPGGWLLCNGAAVNRTTYSRLYAAIGATWGNGDGSTTFNVPNGQGRSLIGAGTGPGLSTRTLGQSLGEEAHTLTSSEMPAHSHTGSTNTDGAHIHDIPTSNTSLSDIGVGRFTTGSDPFEPFGPQVNSNGSSHSHAFTTNNTGGGTSHNNIQPSIVVQYIIKY